MPGTPVIVPCLCRLDHHRLVPKLHQPKRNAFPNQRRHSAEIENTPSLGLGNLDVHRIEKQQPTGGYSGFVLQYEVTKWGVEDRTWIPR